MLLLSSCHAYFDAYAFLSLIFICVFHVFRFGNASIKRLVDWLNESILVSHGNSILDVGCGNGMTLVSLVGIYLFYLFKTSRYMK